MLELSLDGPSLLGPGPELDTGNEVLRPGPGFKGSPGVRLIKMHQLFYIFFMQGLQKDGWLKDENLPENLLY